MSISRGRFRNLPMKIAGKVKPKEHTSPSCGGSHAAVTELGLYPSPPGERAG